MAIEIVKFMQSLRNDFLDIFFTVVTMFGEEIFLVLILVVIYFMVDKKFGEFLGFSLLSSLVINNVIKDIVKAPRPFQVDSDIVNLRPETSTGYSFPSGHTQGASTMMYSLSIYKEKTWLYVATGVIIPLVALSRMYIGVHFLRDVLTSILLSVLISHLAKYLFLKFHQKRIYVYLIVAGIVSPFIFIASSTDLFKIYGIFVGYLVGVYFEDRYISFGMDSNKIYLRFIVAIVMVLGIKEGLKFFPEGNFFDMLRYFFVGSLGIFVTGIIIKKLKI